MTTAVAATGSRLLPRARHHLGRATVAGWDHLPWRAQVGLAVVVTIGLLWLGNHQAILVVALLALTGAGFIVWQERHAHARSTYALPRRGWRRRLAPYPVFARALVRPMLIGYAAAAVLHWQLLPGWLRVWPFTAAAVTLTGLVMWRELPAGQAVPKDAWWSHDNLQQTIFHPRVVKWAEATPPKLQFLGPPRTDGFGTSVLVGLPGLSWTTVAAKHAELSALLGQPRRLVTITPGGREHGEHVVRLWVGTKAGDRQPEPSPVGTAGRTVWSGPVRVGLDMRGRVVTFATTGVHSLIVAKTRAGKTWLARIIALHALGDPGVEVWVLNGKDRRADWRSIAPACTRYVAVDDSDDVPKATQFLADLRALCKARKDTDDHGPVLVILEEWRAVRTAAAAISPAALRDLDASAASLGAVAAGYGVHIMALAQRGTADYVAMGLKANMSQRLVGMTVSAAEVEWSIGWRPDGELPSVAGEFLVQTDEDPAVLTQVDVLTDDAWEAAVARAITARRSAGPLPLAPAPAAITAPSTPLERCVALITEHGGMSSSELLGRLPEDDRPRTAEALGRALAASTDVRRGWAGNRHVWHLAGPVGTCGEPAVQPAVGPPTAGSLSTNRVSPAVLAVQP